MSDINSLRKMLKAGVPRGAVEMKCQQAGIDPRQLDEEAVSSFFLYTSTHLRPHLQPADVLHLVKKLRVHWGLRRG